MPYHVMPHHIDKFHVMLAPMAGVTDMTYRAICKELGCSLAFSEMISAKGLTYKNAKTNSLLDISEDEGQIAIQLFGHEPDILLEAASLVIEMKKQSVAIVDINMGCPANKIVSNGDGGALMRDITLASNIIKTLSKSLDIPVTVKFRKGYDENSINAVEFSQMAESSGAAAITIHGRTLAQGYSGRADWGIIAEVKRAVNIPVWANGDVFKADDALRLKQETGCDGIMVARGALGNPFIFREINAAFSGEAYEGASAEERAQMIIRHANMLVAHKGTHGIIEMRKHMGWYVKGQKQAVRLRRLINSASNIDDVKRIANMLTEAE